MSSFFRINEGTLDRALRVTLGLALLAIVFVGPAKRLVLVMACVRQHFKPAPTLMNA